MDPNIVGERERDGVAERDGLEAADWDAVEVISLQSVTLDEPVEEEVPRGQAVALMEERGQYAPAGQRIGAPEEQ